MEEKFYLVYADVPGGPTIVEHFWTEREANYLKQELVELSGFREEDVLVMPVMKRYAIVG